MLKLPAHDLATDAFRTVITVPLLNHAGMDVITAPRVLSENGLSIVLV